MGGLIYTDEQVEWIKEHRNDYPDPNDMVSDFNRLFNVNRTLESISNLCRKRKLVKSTYKKPSEKNKHIGETKKMSCGLEATIMEWRGYNDIDVSFENGVKKEHISYVNFKKGSLTPASIVPIDDFAKTHLNKKKMMNCGYECEIIAIRTKKDIDVRWHDGSVSEHRKYSEFEKGIIKIPARAKWLHQKAEMNCGLMAEIVEFNSTSDILVRFEDGYETRSTTASWSHKTVDNPSCSKKAKKTGRIGERKMMNSGLWGVITEYRGINDIDVLFEDGMKAENVTYTNFVNGSVGHPLMLEGGHYTSRDFHGYILLGRLKLTKNDALYRVITPDKIKDIIYISEIIKETPKPSL